MIFKDINSGFYVLKHPMQYACTHDEVAKMSEANGIVKRAIYNYDQSADANVFPSLLYKFPSIDLYTVLFSSTAMFAKLLQSQNAASPILVTLSPISTLVKLLQLWNT